MQHTVLDDGEACTLRQAGVGACVPPPPELQLELLRLLCVRVPSYTRQGALLRECLTALLKGTYIHTYIHMLLFVGQCC